MIRQKTAVKETRKSECLLMLLLLILEKSMFNFLCFFRCIKKPLTCLYTFIIIFYLLIYSFMPIMKGKAEHVRKNSAVYNIITCSKTRC